MTKEKRGTPDDVPSEVHGSELGEGEGEGGGEGFVEQIAYWQARAHDAESALVTFDKLHADGKFLQAALELAFKGLTEEIAVGTMSGAAKLIALPGMAEDKVALLHPRTFDGHCEWFVDTNTLMRVLDWPASMGWAGDFYAIMSPVTLARTIQDMAQMRLYLATGSAKPGPKPQPFRQPTPGGKQ